MKYRFYWLTLSLPSPFPLDFILLVLLIYPRCCRLQFHVTGFQACMCFLFATSTLIFLLWRIVWLAYMFSPFKTNSVKVSYQPATRVISEDRKSQLHLAVTGVFFCRVLLDTWKNTFFLKTGHPCLHRQITNYIFQGQSHTSQSLCLFYQSVLYREKVCVYCFVRTNTLRV